MDKSMNMGVVPKGSAPFAAYFYGRIFWFCLLSFFTLGAAASWSSIILARRRRSSAQKARTGRYFSVVSIIREASYLQYPFFGLTLPTQGQLNVCAIYTILLLSCLLSQVWSTIPVFWEAISMRAAYLSLAQLVLLVALAAKKNFVACLFATSHERINVFHRYVSLCMLMTTTMHMGYFLREWLYYDVWASQWELLGQAVLIWGVSAWSILIFINATSISFIRNRFYSYWLPVHITSMVALSILVGRHVTPPSRLWLYVVAGLFFLDRSLRIGSRLNCMRSRWTNDGVIIEALPGGAIRVTVPNQSLPFQKPGQWAYLSLYQIGIHSHPFTINSQPKSGKLVFLLRAKHGLTRALHDRTDEQLPPSSTMRYSLEGPYGGMYLPPACFDTVLLVAGGVGASFTMSLLTSLMVDPGCCRRVQVLWMVKEEACLSWFEDQIEEAFRQATKHSIELDVRLHITCDAKWSAEERSKLKTGLSTCACKEVKTSGLDYFGLKGHSTASSLASNEITQYGSLLQSAGQSEQCCCTQKESRREEIQRVCGRPNLQRAILQHLMQDERQGESGIFACGPIAMTRELRTAVVRASDMLAVKKGSGREAVYLHVENQG